MQGSSCGVPARLAAAVLLAAAPAFAQSGGSSGGMKFSSPCTFTYADGSSYEHTVNPYVCDYINTQDPGALDKFSSMNPGDQKSFLQSNLAQANQAYSEYQQKVQQAHQEAASALAGSDQSSHGADLGRLQNAKDALQQQEEDAAAPFAANRAAYVSTLEADKQQLDQAISRGQRGLMSRQSQETNQAASKFQSQENSNTDAGRLNSTAKNLNQGGDAQQANGRLFENNARSANGALSDRPQDQGMAQLNGSAAMGLNGTRYTSYNINHLNESIVPEEEGPRDNPYVQAIKSGQAKMEDWGASALTSADEQSRLADQTKAEQDAKASAAWNSGHPVDAAWEKAKGWASWSYHTGAQVADTGGAVGLATVSGVGDVARGDPVAVKKVAIGAAAAVAAPAVAAVATAGTVTAGVAAVVGGGAEVYGVYNGTQHFGNAVSAHSWGQATANTLEGAADIGGGYAAKWGLGALAKYAPETMKAVEETTAGFLGSSTKAFADTTEGTFVGKAIRSASESSEEWAPKVASATHETVVEHGIIEPTAKYTAKRMSGNPQEQ